MLPKAVVSLVVGLMVHPGKLAREMLRTAQDLGVEVFKDSPVTHLSAQKDSIELGVAAGIVRATKVALATNAWK